MKKGIKSAVVAVMAIIMLRICLPAAAGASSASADFAVDDYKSLVETVAQQYIGRAPVFTVRYNACLSEVKSKLVQGGSFFSDVFSVDIPGTTADLDYLHNNIKTMCIDWQHNGTYAICEFTQTYLTTASQENEVDIAVGQALRELDIADSSMYGRVKAIHDYIIKTTDYDFTYKRYSAYDVLYGRSAVCQGYALLMYRMLMEAGVPARFISGEAVTGGERGLHAWNIVKIGRYWYNVDVTWDDSYDTTKYFLKNNTVFSNHYRGSEYASDAFYAAHPVSPYNFDPSQDVKPVRSIALSPDKGALCAVGDVFMLSAAITPADATDKTLSWSSSHPGVASIDSAGRVTVNGPGTAVITATAADGTGKSADFILTAYVPDTPSAWAANDISALNARGIIPTELNTRFKADITRAEFMALIASVFRYAKGSDFPPGNILFTDITTNPYKDQIAMCHQLGIIDGKGNRFFAPDDTLTRQECAKIISSAVKVINSTDVYSDAALRYADVSVIAAWALPYVRYAYQTGLMQGSDGCFNPYGVLSREQAMTVIERMIMKYGW